MKRLYIRFKSLVNDFVYSFGRAALLLLVEVSNHTVPVRERRRIRVKAQTACLSRSGKVRGSNLKTSTSTLKSTLTVSKTYNHS